MLRCRPCSRRRCAASWRRLAGGTNRSSMRGAPVPVGRSLHAGLRTFAAIKPTTPRVAQQPGTIFLRVCIAAIVDDPAGLFLPHAPTFGGEKQKQRQSAGANVQGNRVLIDLWGWISCAVQVSDSWIFVGVLSWEEGCVIFPRRPTR